MRGMRAMYAIALGALVAVAMPSAAAMDATASFDPDLPQHPTPFTISDGGEGSEHDDVDTPSTPDDGIAETRPGWTAESTSFHVRYTSPHLYSHADFTFKGSYAGVFTYTDTDGECLDAETRHAFEGSMRIQRALPADKGLATFRFIGAHNGEASFLAEARDEAPTTLLDVEIDGTLAAPDLTRYVRYGFYVPAGVDKVDIELEQTGTPAVYAAIYNAHGTAVATLDAHNGGSFAIDNVRAIGGIWQLAIHGGFSGSFSASVTTA